MAKKRGDRRAKDRFFSLAQWLEFTHLRPFDSQWCALALSDESLARLQLQLIADPTAGAVVEGTGGLRKLRFAPPELATGKRGGLRVWYADIEEASTIILALVYQKVAKEDLNAEEKKAVKKVVDRFRELLLSRRSKRRGAANEREEDP